MHSVGLGNHSEWVSTERIKKKKICNINVLIRYILNPTPQKKQQH